MFSLIYLAGRHNILIFVVLGMRNFLRVTPVNLERETPKQLNDVFCCKSKRDGEKGRSYANWKQASEVISY